MRPLAELVGPIRMKGSQGVVTGCCRFFVVLRYILGSDTRYLPVFVILRRGGDKYVQPTNVAHRFDGT